MYDVESANECFPPGTYRYVQEYGFGLDDVSGPPAFEWGFTLRVERG